jgi:N-acetylneuraminate synthase
MSGRIFVIAEAGVNHDGSWEKALALIDVAHRAGADAVKFQTFSADRLATAAAPKAAYQTGTIDPGESQHAMLRRLELSHDDHRVLLAHCRQRGIEFLSTPFDEINLQFLAKELHVPKIKLGSGEVTNAPLLLAAAQTGLPVILSTGMATLDEVEAARGVLAFGYLGSRQAPGAAAFAAAYAQARAEGGLAGKVVLLHCTTEYPAPFADVNLNAMETMRKAFGVPVGYSDHTPGIAISIAAAAMGATIIEKHFTLDRRTPGPDHAASLEPPELMEMIACIRQVELAHGDGVKAVRDSERANMAVARKAIVAARPIAAGERLGAENLTVKRAGGGVGPMRWWDVVGTQARRAYAPDEAIEL